MHHVHTTSHTGLIFLLEPFLGVEEKVPYKRLGLGEAGIYSEIED
jgi:hypothetical protein